MQLVARAKQWAQADPDPATKEELLRLIEAAQAGDKDAKGQLKDAFSGPLQFGTAGLRGALGPGESRMNEAVVVRATAGLMSWLNSKVATPRVVMGAMRATALPNLPQQLPRSLARPAAKRSSWPPHNPLPSPPSPCGSWVPTRESW